MCRTSVRDACASFAERRRFVDKRDLSRSLPASGRSALTAYQRYLMWSRRIEAATYRRRGRRVAIAADDCSDSASIDKRDFANGGAPRSSPPALAVLVVEEGDRPVKARTGARRGVACKGTGPVANDPVLGAVVRRLALMRQGHAPRGVRDRLRGQPHAHAIAWRGASGQRWRDRLRGNELEGNDG